MEYAVLLSLGEALKVSTTIWKTSLVWSCFRKIIGIFKFSLPCDFFAFLQWFFFKLECGYIWFQDPFLIGWVFWNSVDIKKPRRYHLTLRSCCVLSTVILRSAHDLGPEVIHSLRAPPQLLVHLDSQVKLKSLGPQFGSFLFFKRNDLGEL